MGVFGFGEIIANLGQPPELPRRSSPGRSGACGPTWQDFRHVFPAVLRGTGPRFRRRARRPAGGVLLASCCGLYAGEEVARLGPARCPSDRAISAARPGPRRRTTPARRPRSSPCSPWHPAQCRDGPDGRGDDDVGTSPGRHDYEQQPTAVLGPIASMWVEATDAVRCAALDRHLDPSCSTAPHKLLFPAITLFCCIGVYSRSSNSTFAPVHDGTLRADRLRLPQAELRGRAAAADFYFGSMMEENLRRASAAVAGQLVFHFRHAAARPRACWRPRPCLSRS